MDFQFISELILQPNFTLSSLFFSLCMGEWMHACTCLSLGLSASIFSHSASFLGTKKQKRRVVAGFINEVLARAPPPLPHLLCFKYPEHRFPWRLRGPGSEADILQILCCRLQPGGHSQISPALEFAPNEEAMWAMWEVVSCRRRCSGLAFASCMRTCSFSRCLPTQAGIRQPEYVNNVLTCVQSAMPVRWVLTLTLEDEKQKGEAGHFRCCTEENLFIFKEQAENSQFMSVTFPSCCCVCVFIITTIIIYATAFLSAVAQGAVTGVSLVIIGVIQ